MSYPFIRYSQAGGDFYACVIRAVDIVFRLEIRRRSEDGLDGIQRDENLKRVREISNYLRTSDAILPTPIIVSSFEDGVIISGNNIVLADGSAPVAHILDGQHRVLGLLGMTPKELEQIEILVVFVFGIDPYSEATIFSTINSNQRQVSKSLIYDLFGLSPNRSKERVGHEICKSLNDDSESPFYRRIKLLGKKAEDSETLSQAAFIDHLIAAMNVKGRSVLGELYESREDWVIRKVVANVFLAIERTQSESLVEIPPDYFFRTTGYGGVMKSLPPILQSGWEQQTLDSDFFTHVFIKYFRRLRELPAGTGNSAMLQIMRSILAANELTESSRL